MRLRKLRIAWSLVWGITAVLLIVLWVRSYRWREMWYYRAPNQSLVSAETDDGIFFVTFGEVYPPRAVPTWSHLKLDSTSVRQKYTDFDLSKFGRSKGEKLRLRLPAWLTVFALPIVAVLPWLPRRFALRTLFIVTTLIASALGLAVWAAK
jgi:hypothetical protein